MSSAGQQQPPDAATANVITRPPFLYLGGILLGLVLDRLLPLPIAVPGMAATRWSLGGVLMLIGVAILVAGIRNFSRAATPVPSNQPVRALVTNGMHGFSRNPIYVGMFCIYLGIGVAAASPWILILVLPLAITLRYGVVAREEAYLEGLFGHEYRDYRARVRRWL